MSVRGVYSHSSIVLLTKFKTNHKNTTLYELNIALHQAKLANFSSVPNKPRAPHSGTHLYFKIKVLQKMFSPKLPIISPKWLTDNRNLCLLHFVTILCRPGGHQSVNGLPTLINSIILKFSPGIRNPFAREISRAQSSSVRCVSHGCKMPKRNKTQLTNGSLIFVFASVCRAQKYSKLQRQLYLQGERLDQDILSLHSNHFTRVPVKHYLHLLLSVSNIPS